MPADHVSVQLGDAEYVLVPQKHTYLKRKLGVLFDSLSDSDLTGAGSLMDVIGDKLYEVCKIFIPGLMSEEQWNDDETAPTYPQIEIAITTGLRVNGLDKVKQLGKIISPELIRALLQQQMAELVARSMTTSLPSSPPPSGAPTPTTSAAPSPISPAPIDSDGPSSESAPSSSPATSDAPATSELLPVL